MSILRKNWLKFSIGIVSCTLLRLIPFRPPNIEPILAVQMPFSRAYGPFFGFFFAFLNIVIYDFLTFKVGVWTLVTSFAYGALGIIAFYFFKRFQNDKWNYLVFAILGTVFFDIITGIGMGVFIFNQSFSATLIGQIPFTLLHLLGNITFSLVLSKNLYKYIIKNEKLERLSIINVFNLKKI